MFDAISEEFGITVEFLEQEMLNRTKHLEWMQKNNIKDYEDVALAIRRYARTQDALLEDEQREHSLPERGEVENIEDVIKELAFENAAGEEKQSLGNSSKSPESPDSSIGEVA
jgi:E3 ubiquitin-protein ligase DOA10